MLINITEFLIDFAHRRSKNKKVISKREKKRKKKRKRKDLVKNMGGRIREVLEKVGREKE